MRSYRTIELRAKSGDPDLAPLSSDVTKAVHEAAGRELTARGYELMSGDTTDLVLYAGLAKIPSKGMALVIRVADRARRKLVWQRSEVLGEAPAPEAVTAAFAGLIAAIPKAADRPVAY